MDPGETSLIVRTLRSDDCSRDADHPEGQTSQYKRVSRYLSGETSHKRTSRDSADLLNFESPNCLFCNNLPLCSQLFCQAGLHSNDPILATKESKVQPPKLDRMALTVGQLVEGVTPIT